MRSSCLGKLVLNLFITGCVILCYSVCNRASLTYVDDTVVFHELSEGDNMTIDCTTTEPAYYTALSFHRQPIPRFYLAPNGRKLIQIGQSFTVTNLTEQDAGDYGCIAKDKDLQNSTISKAELLIILPPKLKLLKYKTVVETASMKLAGSKPYLYFKVKSPVRVSVTDRKPFNLSVSVKGLQPIKIYWNKDLHELVIGSRYKTFDNNRRLIIESPFTEEDSGTYSAIACNTKGCEVRGVQVMFHTMLNKTLSKGQGYGTGGSQRFMGDWVKEYGFLGIPLGIAIILIIAIVIITRSKKNEEGRKASLWSWHSDGESSPDEMPDYDRMKSKKQSKRHQAIELEEDFEMHAYQGENEETEHYTQLHYSHEETFYDTGDREGDRFLQDTDAGDGVNYSTDEDRGPQITYRHDETSLNTGGDDVTIRESEERFDHDAHHFMTEDSYHSVTAHSRDSDADMNVDEEPREDSNARMTVDAQPQESMLSSFFGYMRNKVKQIKHSVSPTEQPPPPSPAQDTDTQVIQNTVVEESQVTQQTAVTDTQGTVVNLPQVRSDMVAENTEVTQATLATDTEVKDIEVSQDTVARNIKVTQGTIAKVTPGKVVEDTEVIQWEVAKADKMLIKADKVDKAVVVVVAEDTKATKDTVAKDTKVTSGKVAKDNEHTGSEVTKADKADMGDKAALAVVAEDNKVTQGTFAKDTEVTQGSAAKGTTKVTEGEVANETEGTQDEVGSEIEGHDFFTLDFFTSSDIYDFE